MSTGGSAGHLWLRVHELLAGEGLAWQTTECQKEIMGRQAPEMSEVREGKHDGMGLRPSRLEAPSVGFW